MISDVSLLKNVLRWVYYQGITFVFSSLTSAIFHSISKLPCSINLRWGPFLYLLLIDTDRLGKIHKVSSTIIEFYYLILLKGK